MNELLCKTLGHVWKLIWEPGARSKTAPAYVCTRCNENGWKLL